MPKIKLLADGGSMKPGPAVAQQLGPMGVNLGKVIQEVNTATAEFKGMKVPVELDVDPQTKEFTITVFSPPTSELLKQEIKVEKASKEAGRVAVGNLAIEQIIAIAKTKLPNMLAKDLKSAVRLVVGSCTSSGILVEGKSSIEVQKEIEKGIYDKEISQGKTEVSPDKKQKMDKIFAEIKSKQEAAAKAIEAAKAAAEAEKAETTAAAAPAVKKEEPAKKK